MYDVTSRSSFENAEKVWLRELRNAADSTSSLLDCLVLVGNKLGEFARPQPGGALLLQDSCHLVSLYHSTLTWPCDRTHDHVSFLLLRICETPVIAWPQQVLIPMHGQ